VYDESVAQATQGKKLAFVSSSFGQFLAQIAGQLLDKPLSVSGPILSVLLQNDDAPSNLPIRRRHDRVDIPGGS